MCRKCLVLGATLVGITCLSACCAAVVANVFEIGSGEHYEVMKALLWANGYTLYNEVWNDQPPLYTVVIGLMFKAFGPGIAVARAVAATFGLSLVVALATQVNRQCGVPAATVGAFCLLAAPQTLVLSISAMLEVPAIGTALWALWPIHRWRETQKLHWLALSGVLMAAALQIKLTAAIVLPALVVEIFLGLPGLTGPAWRRETARALGIWGVTVTATFIGLAIVFGTVPLAVLWASHFSPKTLAKATDSLRWPFLQPLYPDHADAIFGAGAGLLILAYRRNWRGLAFPCIWLVTAAVIHQDHRPWWPYYYLHFAVPLAWLSGYGVMELFKLAWIEGLNRVLLRRLVGIGSLLVASLLFAFIVTAGEMRLRSAVAWVGMLPRIDDGALVSRMREFAGGTQWVYTKSTMYAFHAKLPVIPPLAVLPLKRFWSGQITEGQILTIVKHYRPEQMLLNEELSSEMKEFVNTNYALVHEYGRYQLFVRNSLVRQ